MVKSKIEIFALPLKSTYILFSPEYRQFLQDTVNANGGINKISKIINFDKNYFFRLRKGMRCSLNLVFSLYNTLALDLEELNKNIYQIVSGHNNSVGIRNPKVPFDFDNKYGGCFLGAIMGDGSRTRLGGLTYNNQKQNIIKLLIKCSEMIFGNVKYRINYKKDGTIQIDYPKIVGDIVGLLGIEKSYKVISDCSINLENFSREFRKSFIRQFFDDEGNVRKKDRRLQVKQTRQTVHDKKTIRTNIENYAPKILLKIKNVLKEFNIISKIYLESLRELNGEKKADFSLNIYGKENLMKFNDNFGFNIDYKNKLLRKVIESYKFPSAPRNGRILFALQHAARIELKRGFIDKFELAKSTGRALWGTCSYYLVDLKKLNLIHVIEIPKNKKTNSLVWRYKITNKGWEYLKMNVDKIFLDDVKNKIIISPLVFSQ